LSGELIYIRASFVPSDLQAPLGGSQRL
jgi:hypothetical protein